MEKIIVIYQKPYEDLLREVVSENVDVVLWLPAELVNKDISQFEEQINQICEKEVQPFFCLMISWRPYKSKVYGRLKAFGIDDTRIIDIYKAYMAHFPIKRYQRIMDQKSNEELDGLVLGISHGWAGIVEEKMPGNVCNLCTSSQDIYFNYLVLENICKEYYDNIRALKYVVFDMFDYTYFNFDTIQTGAYQPFLEENGFWCEERYNWNKQCSLEQINEWLKVVWQEGETEEQQEKLFKFFPYIFEKDECVYKGSVLKSRKHILTKEEIEEYIENFSPISLQKNVYENTIEFQITNFERILKLLRDINPQIKVYLVLLPKYFAVEEKEQESNILWKPFFYNIIEEFQEEYPFLELIDMKNCELFSANKELYEDITHFNYSGACGFTEYLSMILQNQFGLLQQQKEGQKDYWYDLLKQLIDALNNGYINENTIGYFSYYHLVALFDIAKKLSHGKDLYLQIKTFLENINIQRLKKQEKIVVGFIANYSSTWIGDELYRLFEVDDRYEPYIILLSNHNGQTEELLVSEYKKNLIFFEERKLRVLQTMDLVTGRQYTWEEIGVKPQICIWTTPWISLFRKDFYLLNYSLDTLHTYIPYGFFVAENKMNSFSEEQYNQLLHNVSWCNFEDSINSVKMAERYAFVGSQNAEYTGYPKMDDFFDTEKEEESIWDKLIEKSGLIYPKRIIYAPHHTIDDRELSFSTFADNYKIMLALAEKYQDKTVWIFKPHPVLRYKAIRSGVFNDLGDWESYLNEWKQMKNAEVVEDGDYKKLLLESDAMILDSVSFLAEYLYAHKPLLFLKREEQRFNLFGQGLMDIHYSVDGNDEKAIGEFIQNVVLENRDEMYIQREQFFEENLNYMRTKGQKAAVSIYKWFCSRLEKE